MKVLSVKQACVVIRLSDLGPSNLPLLEQARPYITASPFVVLDVDGIHFSSMLLGEVVNLYVGFNTHWKDRRHVMAMVNVAEVSKQVFTVSKLTERIPVYNTVEDAMRSFTQTQLKTGTEN